MIMANFGTWNYVILVVGALCVVYGIVSAIMRKPAKSKLESFTEESCKLWALVEGIITAVMGAAIVLSGLAYDGAVITQTWVIYVGLGIVAVGLILEFVLEKKISKPLPKDGTEVQK